MCLLLLLLERGVSSSIFFLWLRFEDGYLSDERVLQPTRQRDSDHTTIVTMVAPEEEEPSGLWM
jgi:hypothetical protein